MRASRLMLLLLLALTGVGTAHGASILFVTLPGGLSHHMQSLALARSLAARNHTAHLLLPDYDEAALRRLGMLGEWVTPVVCPTPPGTEDAFQELVRAFSDRPREFMALHLAHFRGVCRRLLGDAALLAALRSARYDALVADSTFQCAFVLAGLLGVPRRIDLSPTHLVDPFWSKYWGLPYSPALNPFIGSGLGGPPMSFLERAASTLLSPLVYWYGDGLALESARSLAAELGLPRPRAVADKHREAVLLLVNQALGLSAPRSLPPAVQLVGPLLVGGEPRPLPAELDVIVRAAGEAGVALLSFGTAFRPASCALVRGLAGALAALAPRHAIWAVNATYFPGQCPLGSLDLPPTVHVLPWVPQADLLAHPATKAFITHAGLNSMYEAAWHGTPVVCLPQAADHPDVCAWAVKSGWALQENPRTLGPSRAAALAAKVAQVASEPAFAANAAAAGAVLRAHPRPAAERAADAIEWALALPPGASLRDPAAAMPWWQRHCLDVYAAAAAPLAAALAAAWPVAGAAWRAAWRQAAAWPRVKTD